MTGTGSAPSPPYKWQDFLSARPSPDKWRTRSDGSPPSSSPSSSSPSVMGHVRRHAISDRVRMRHVSHHLLQFHAGVCSHQVALHDGCGSGLGGFCGAVWTGGLVATRLGVPPLRDGCRHGAISSGIFVSVVLSNSNTCS